MKLSYLVRGLPGHPLHPPLTGRHDRHLHLRHDRGGLRRVRLEQHDGGPRVVARAAGRSRDHGRYSAHRARRLAPITRGTELWKTATAHMVAMVTATVFFGLAALTGHGDWKAGNVHGAPLVLTIVGFLVLTLGGWLGGAIVFTHGMRVLKLVDEPATRAVSPLPKPEKEAAEA